MEDNMKPTSMLVAVIVTIGVMLFVGIVLMDGLSNASDVSNTESFTVADPGVDKVCSLDYTPSADFTVQYYNGTAWSTLALTTDYTISGRVVTVKASAMD